MIINYRTFESNVEFVKWQMDHDNAQVFNVMPFVTKANVDLKGEQTNVDGGFTTEVGIFVTYGLKEAENG